MTRQLVSDVDLVEQAELDRLEGLPPCLPGHGLSYGTCDDRVDHVFGDQVPIFVDVAMLNSAAYRRGDGGRRDVGACCSKVGVAGYVSEGGAGAWAICYGEAAHGGGGGPRCGRGDREKVRVSHTSLCQCLKLAQDAG